MTIRYNQQNFVLALFPTTIFVTIFVGVVVLILGGTLGYYGFKLLFAFQAQREAGDIIENGSWAVTFFLLTGAVGAVVILFSLCALFLRANQKTILSKLSSDRIEIRPHGVALDLRSIKAVRITKKTFAIRSNYLHKRIRLRVSLELHGGSLIALAKREYNSKQTDFSKVYDVVEPLRQWLGGVPFLDFSDPFVTNDVKPCVIGLEALVKKNDQTNIVKTVQDVGGVSVDVGCRNKPNLIFWFCTCVLIAFAAVFGVGWGLAFFGIVFFLFGAVSVFTEDIWRFDMTKAGMTLYYQKIAFSAWRYFNKSLTLRAEQVLGTRVYLDGGANTLLLDVTPDVKMPLLAFRSFAQIDSETYGTNDRSCLALLSVDDRLIDVEDVLTLWTTLRQELARN